MELLYLEIYPEDNQEVDHYDSDFDIIINDIHHYIFDDILFE
jgi:hypothetical protein